MITNFKYKHTQNQMYPVHALRAYWKIRYEGGMHVVMFRTDLEVVLSDGTFLKILKDTEGLEIEVLDHPVPILFKDVPSFAVFTLVISAPVPREKDMVLHQKVSKDKAIQISGDRDACRFSDGTEVYLVEVTYDE